MESQAETAASTLAGGTTIVAARSIAALAKPLTGSDAL
jgi:hypothetical protein